MTVTLHPYKKDLPLLFEKEKEKILHLIPSIIHIHHVGSTAIDGLSGKNIIDILIGLETYIDLEQLSKKLEKLGYITKWIHYEDEWTYLSTKLHSASEGDFHIHILRYGSKSYNDMLLFRDYLNSHKDERKNYEKLKPLWLKQSKGVGMAYAKLKTKYIQTVLDKAGKE